MLLRFSKPCSAFSYSDLMGDAFGTIGKILLQISVIVNNIGCLVVYMIIIGLISMISPSCVSVSFTCDSFTYQVSSFIIGQMVFAFSFQLMPF